MSKVDIQSLLSSRRSLVDGLALPRTVQKSEEEGGCGVVGFCCTEAVSGRHIYEPSRLMHNRGNGKGGGVAAVGFIPEQMGVSREVLEDCYMLHIALLDNSIRTDLEKKYIQSNFDIASISDIDTVDDWTTIKGLEVKPPDVVRYFVRVKPEVLDHFISSSQFEKLNRRAAEDEFLFQNSFKLNQEFYSSLGEQKAFVLSHGRNLMILKVVGYAEAIVQYYKIEDLCAHVWIAHQRFPTKGRVWHPGGAHPFAGINMALVHNGDFANYHSVSEYLIQRHIYPQFLTDTEVSALMFDLLNRTYNYPLEYIIEALAPTTELDFDHLPEDKQSIYRAIQASHIHGSPDGPWFFIIARNIPENQTFQLLGITDTAMLRPQVFALSEGDVQVGLICSEKQAIDATLSSLSKEDHRICPVADRYWNARGGSHTDGGSFIFNLTPDSNGKMQMTCTDKFGQTVPMPEQREPCDFSSPVIPDAPLTADTASIMKQLIGTADSEAVFDYMTEKMESWGFDDLRTACRIVLEQAEQPDKTDHLIRTLTSLNDLYFSTGTKKRSHLLHILRTTLNSLFDSIPDFMQKAGKRNKFRRIDFNTRTALRAPQENETTLVLNAALFPPEGNECDAVLLVDAYRLGWNNFICYNCVGQRYIGCGLGPETDNVKIDVYGSSGDYLASGIDGLTIRVHGNGQDQLGQIMKKGKLVVFGDVGQTFMYGAKGGEVFVMGNAAGRPLINSVGRPKVVINGTCLDFLAESFMAGDPHNGGGFVILNGIKIDSSGNLVPLPEPYPGSNMFSLASGGAIFIRDPFQVSVNNQLNGGMFLPLDQKDWKLIRPLLEENERLFGIKLNDLLSVNGEQLEPVQVYRKVVPIKVGEMLIRQQQSASKTEEKAVAGIKG